MRFRAPTDAIRHRIRCRLIVCGVVSLSVALAVSGCSRLLQPKYEYEEELFLNLDGSGTLFLHSSVPALVALHDVSLDLDPRARLDRSAIRRMFDTPATPVTRVSTSQREGRRFLHVRMRVNDVRELGKDGPLRWSSYSLNRRSDQVVFAQRVVSREARSVNPSTLGLRGSEMVAFRVHMPSRIAFHNAEGIGRGNILRWTQTLADRLTNRPLQMEARMEAQSILHATLRLFGLAFLAALVVIGGLIWWIARKGSKLQAPASRG